MKIIIAAPIICFLQFFVMVGQIANSISENLEEWASA